MLKLDIHDLDDLIEQHAPHLAVGPPAGVPDGASSRISMVDPSAAGLYRGAAGRPKIAPPTMSSAEAPTLAGPSFAPPEFSAPPTIARPTRSESNDAGRREFMLGMPTVTDEVGSPGFYKERLAQEEYKREHPWGSPISEHPGFIGKVGHALATAGNIAGSILAPGTTALIPGSQLNRQAVEAGLTRNLDRARQLDIEREGVEQKPELAAAAGELKGRLESQKEAAQDKRLGETLSSQDQRARDREDASNAALSQREDAAEKRQGAQFTEQEKLANQREAGAERRLQENLSARADNASRKDIATHDKEYVVPAEQIERSYELYREAQDAFNRGDAKTGAASMLALSQHLGTTFGQVKGSRMNRDLIAEHRDAIGIQDRIERYVESLRTGQQLAPNQIKEFGDLIGNMRKLTWQMAAKEADRKHVPIDFLPDDLQNMSHTPGQKGSQPGKSSDKDPLGIL